MKKTVHEHQVNQNSPEWLKLRENKVTASNAHILLKNGVQAAISRNNGNNGGGYWAERGHILEDEAIEIWEAVHEAKSRVIGFITNDLYPDCGYSPDREKLEVKCFADAKHLVCLEDIPVEVYCQCQFGMMIAGWNEMSLIFYNPNIEDNQLCYKEIKIKKDKKLIKRFEDKLGVKK